MNINKKFIEDKVFKKEFGDKSIIEEEFHEFITNSNKTPIKILYVLYGNELTAEDISKEFTEITLQSLKVTISRLNKNLKIKVINTNNKTNIYTLNRKGVADLNHLILEYTRGSEYVQDYKKEELKDSKNLNKKFNNFFEECKSSEIRKYSQEIINHLEISIIELSEFDFKLADEVLDNPEESILRMKSCLKNNYMNELEKSEEEIQIRFIDIPATSHLHIGNRRTKHLNKLVQMTGMIKRKTTPNPKITYLNYSCTNEGCNFAEDKLKIPQFTNELKILKACPKCKSGVELIEEIKTDYQYILLEEDISVKDDLDSSIAKIKCVLLNGLTSPLNDKKNSPGTKITINGILKDEIVTKAKAKTTTTTFYLEVNNLINDNELNEIKLTKEDIKEIEKFGNDPECFEKLKRNYIPEIEGHKKLKESLLLQQFGGCEFGKKRNDTHILMIGDPGVGKSAIAKQHSLYSPKSIYASGQSSSKAGLTASVVKDELTGDYAVEAGAMPLANGGIFVCDEMDKMNAEDTSSMHEGMEQQTISINKAARMTLQTKCAVLGGANPIKSKFDDALTIDQQVKFPASLLSRFDIIAILKDQPNKKRDEKIASHVLDQYSEEEIKTEIDKTFYKKFIYYTKHHKKAIMTEEVNKFLTKEYIKRRTNYDAQSSKFSFGTRQLEGWARFTFAIAKANFSNELKIEHAQKAIEIVDYFNEKLGFANIQAIEKAEHDLNYIDTSAQLEIKKIIINNNNQKKDTKYSELAKIFKDTEKLKVNLKKLKANGTIMEHKKGVYTLLGGKK